MRRARRRRGAVPPGDGAGGSIRYAVSVDMSVASAAGSAWTAEHRVAGGAAVQTRVAQVRCAATEAARQDTVRRARHRAAPGSTVTTWCGAIADGTGRCDSSPSTATWPNPSCAATISAAHASSSTPMSSESLVWRPPGACWGGCRRADWCATNFGWRGPPTRWAPMTPRRRSSTAPTVFGPRRWLDLTLPPATQVEVVGHAAAAGADGDQGLGTESGGVPDRAAAVATDLGGHRRRRTLRDRRQTPSKAKAPQYPDGVRDLGFVDDLPGFLGTCRAMIAPISTGGGVRVKILDAARMGCRWSAPPPPSGHRANCWNSASTMTTPTSSPNAAGCCWIRRPPPRRETGCTR